MKIKLVFLIVFLCSFVTAQRLPLQNYTTRNGLLSNFVSKIFQDSRGYIWIGTDEGFSLYDGYQFKNFPFAEGKIWGQVNDIRESAIVPGQIWIATNGGGVIRFYNNEQTFYSIGTNSLANKVNSTIENSDGSLWCATDDGLYLLIDTLAKKLPTVPLGQNTKLLQEKNGTIWCTDENQLFLFSPERRTISFPVNN